MTHIKHYRYARKIWAGGKYKKKVGYDKQGKGEPIYETVDTDTYQRSLFGPIGAPKPLTNSERRSRIRAYYRNQNAA